VWILNLAGVVLALYVFMADTILAAQRGLEAIRTALPERFNWTLFCVALIMMGMPLMQLLWQRCIQKGSVVVITANSTQLCPRYKKAEQSKTTTHES
jgi:hypothetical protein